MINDIKNFNIPTTDQEKQERLASCEVCPENTESPFGTICARCACPISYVISQKFKTCPLGKW